MKKLLALEALYPTRTAWPYADAAVDKLPLTATLHDAIVTWERTYFAAGGKPGKPRT